MTAATSNTSTIKHDDSVGLDTVTTTEDSDNDYTSMNSLPQFVTDLQNITQHTIPIEQRRSLLTQLKSLLIDHASELRDAEYKDLRRPARFHDQIRMGCIKTCDYYLDNLDNLTADKIVNNPPPPAPGSRANRSRIRQEPAGVVLIIGTWNFPLPLALKPLATAFAAGCPVILKLNEVCFHTSKLLLRLLPQIGSEYFKVVYGGRQHTELLLKYHYGLIFFTGGTSIGKSIYQKAAETLSPVCLELGGKNPVFITKTANLETAALKLVDTKFQNVGQFCVSPDHVLIEEGVDVERFKTLLKDAVVKFFGVNPKESPNYSRIINKSHYRRLLEFLDPKDHGGEILTQNENDENDHYISPTLIFNPKVTSKLLTDEIFGPILPFSIYQSLDTAINIENTKKTHPLALYIFSNNNEEIEKIISSTRSGGICVNDCITHMLAENLPFGGIGHSGFGNYRGEWGFRTFSHERAVMEFSANDFNEMRIPSPS